MPLFVDDQKREWVVTVNVGAVKRVRDEAGVDLDNVSEMFEKISDTVTLCRVVYAIIRPDADRKQVTLDGFLDSISGDSIASAEGALIEALTNFFPPTRREPFRLLVGKIREMQAVETARLINRFGELSTSAPGS